MNKKGLKGRFYMKFSLMTENERRKYILECLRITTFVYFFCEMKYIIKKIIGYWIKVKMYYVRTRKNKRSN